MADESAGAATLARVEPDGSVHEALRGRAAGPPKGRRVWDSTADGTNGPVAPDGIAADPQGGIWVANGLGAECLRFDEGGEVTAHARRASPATPVRWAARMSARSFA